MNRERQHIYVNEDYASFVGWAPDALLGRTVAEVLGEAAFATLRPLGDRALAGETVRWEGWLAYTGGAAPRFMQRVYTPYRSDTGAVEGYLVVVKDLTDQRQGERHLSERLSELQLSQALNAAITASALDCIVVIDETGCVVEFNPAAERTFGVSYADVRGRPIGDIIVPPHLRERHARGFARYLATGEAHVLGRRLEIEGMRANGEVFPLELAITEVRLPQQRLFTAYLRDLTGPKKAEAELQRSREALQQSEKMAAFGSLLAGVAHELNNPLSIVIGNAMMLSEDAAAKDPATAARAGKIHLAAQRCGRIVRTFLSMARQRPAVWRPFSIAELVQEALELLAYGLRADGVTVLPDIPHDLPDGFGDPDQINQVLVNLIVNAQQALSGRPMPRRITVTAWADAEALTIAVADNGPGVPAAIRGRVFDPFFTTKPMGEGTGIGLAVSRGIVEAHGGTLVLTTADGGGARFEIRLRTARAEQQARTDVLDETRPFSDDRRRTALIIDDEPEVASILAEFASAAGFDCEILDGPAACRALERQDYHAILCDLHMPEIDGATLFAWLNTRKPHLRNRVVFITADTLGQAASSFLARSGRPVLEKPFLPDEVRKVLDEMRREL